MEKAKCWSRSGEGGRTDRKREGGTGRERKSSSVWEAKHNQCNLRWWKQPCCLVGTPPPFLLSSPSSLWGSLMLHVNLCKKLVQTKRVDHYVIFFFSFSILNKTNRHLWGGVSLKCSPNCWTLNTGACSSCFSSRKKQQSLTQKCLSAFFDFVPK